MTPIRLVLVDDHAILRQGLRAVLERDDDLIIVGEAASEAEAEAVVRATDPDVVLLDLKLSAGSEFEGLSLCAKLSSAYPDLGLLVLTTFLDEDLVVRAVHAGARGYVVKDVDTTELVRAIRADLRGGERIRRAQRRRGGAVDVRPVRIAPAAHRPGDSKCCGCSRPACPTTRSARSSIISATTAKFHVSNIMRKLEVSRRAEAVYAASKRGLI